MASIFDRDHSEKQEAPIYGRERIEGEIAHLKKPQSSRDLKAARFGLARTITILLLLALVSLYLMDVVLFAYYKGDAIRTYLYIHNYGSNAKAQELASTGILSSEDLQILNRRTGSFQDYFPSIQAADEKADQIIHYMVSVNNLHEGKYDLLGPVGKVRYYLFVAIGIPMPSQWSALNPSVSE